MGDPHDNERRRDVRRDDERVDQFRGFPPTEVPFFAGVGALCEVVTRLAGVDGAAVAALMSRQSRELFYATDAVAQQIDELEFAVGEGPCLDAHHSKSPQLWPRMDVGDPVDRWLAFSAGVQELGVQAVFTFPVAVSEHSLGVLELYRRAPGGLDEDQLNYASFCAEAIGHTILSNFPPTDSAIEAALLHTSNPFNRSEVYVASGMIALQLNTSPDEALSRIRAHAYARGVSITVAAGDIVTGRSPLHTWDEHPNGDQKPRSL